MAPLKRQLADVWVAKAATKSRDESLRNESSLWRKFPRFHSRLTWRTFSLTVMIQMKKILSFILEVGLVFEAQMTVIRLRRLYHPDSFYFEPGFSEQHLWLIKKIVLSWLAFCFYRSWMWVGLKAPTWNAKELMWKRNDDVNLATNETKNFFDFVFRKSVFLNRYEEQRFLTAFAEKAEEKIRQES
jgi:hypothetical protein